MASRTACILVNVFDGTRRPIAPDVDLLVRLIDGNRRTISADYHKGPSIHFSGLPCRGNHADSYSVIVSAKDHIQAGFRPVRISPRVVQIVDLMLLARGAGFNFRAAAWPELQRSRPRLFEMFSRGASGDTAARDRYEQLMENHPGPLASLLNFTTALEQVFLASGTPLDYLTEVVWEATPRPDRFFAWASPDLVSQVKLAAQQGVFRPAPATLHPGATRSYKQVQFGEANLQLTFHERDRKRIGGASCIKLETDIDYHRDPAAHVLLEVIPNTVLRRLSDPKTVYTLRWMAGRRAGIPEFQPPYTIE